jgi:uncharacterized membrane protein
MPGYFSDELTRQAITHTRHCLTGCAIGEILGMALGEVFGWPNLWQTTAAVILAFVFGYMLTFYGAIKRKMSRSKAVKTALATDTASITSMEIVDNAFIWIVPGAINATLSSFLFWWSLIVSLAVAFVLTVPVNRFMLSHSSPHSDHH